MESSSNPLSYTFDDPAAVSFMGGLSSVTEEADPPMSTVSQDHAEEGLLAGRMPFTQVPRKEMFSEVSSTLQCKTTQFGDATDSPKCHHCCLGRFVGQYHGLTMTTGAREQSFERGTARLSPRATVLLARYLCAVSLTLTALGLFLLVASRSPVGVSVYAGAPVYDYWLVNTVVAISFSTVGAMITPRLPPQNPIGWLFCTIGLVGGVRLFVAEYAIVTLLAEPGSLPSTLPGGETLAWISSWVWVLHVGLFVILALLFPDGRPASPRWRPLVWASGVVVVAGTVSVALWPETARGFDLLNHPLGTEVATDVINPVETIVYALGLTAAASLFVRLRGSKGVERQQVKWFTYAVAVLATSATLAYVVSESMGVVWLDRVSSVLVIASVVGLPVAVGIAILRYHLYNIDLIINRTLVY